MNTVIIFSLLSRRFLPIQVAIATLMQWLSLPIDSTQTVHQHHLCSRGKDEGGGGRGRAMHPNSTLEPIINWNGMETQPHPIISLFIYFFLI